MSFQHGSLSSQHYLPPPPHQTSFMVHSERQGSYRPIGGDSVLQLSQPPKNNQPSERSQANLITQAGINPNHKNQTKQTSAETSRMQGFQKKWTDNATQDEVIGQTEFGKKYLPLSQSLIFEKSEKDDFFDFCNKNINSQKTENQTSFGTPRKNINNAMSSSSAELENNEQRFYKNRNSNQADFKRIYEKSAEVKPTNLLHFKFLTPKKTEEELVINAHKNPGSAKKSLLKKMTFGLSDKTEIKKVSFKEIPEINEVESWKEFNAENMKGIRNKANKDQFGLCTIF